MDYTKLITPEHLNQPKFMAWLNVTLDMVQDATNILTGMYAYYDIDNAVGTQLDTLGQMLGVPRKLPFQPNNFFNIPVTGATHQTMSSQSAQLFDKNKAVSGYIRSTDGTVQPTSYNNYSSPLILISPSTAYKIAGQTYSQPSGATVGIAWYNFTGTFISAVNYAGATGNGTYTSPANAYYVRYTINTVDLAVSIFEQSSSSNTNPVFAPQSPSPNYSAPITGVNAIVSTDNGINSQTVNLPYELYTNDYYDAITNQGKASNIKTVYSGGSESSVSVNNQNTGYPIIQFLIVQTNKATAGLCSHFKTVSTTNVTDESVQFLPTGFAVSILKTRLSGFSDSWTNLQKITAFKTWLSSNPITVLYIPSTPQTLSGSSLSIPKYQPVTYIYRDDGLFINSYTFSPVMNDTNYRVVLRAVIAEAHFDGTAPSLYQLFQTVLGDTGLYFAVTDNQDMTLSVIVFGVTSSLIADELEHGLIVPRPEGVALALNVTSNKVFAWGIQNTIFDGWGAGYWLMRNEV